MPELKMRIKESHRCAQRHESVHNRVGHPPISVPALEAFSVWAEIRPVRIDRLRFTPIEATLAAWAASVPSITSNIRIARRC